MELCWLGILGQSTGNRSQGDQQINPRHVFFANAEKFLLSNIILGSASEVIMLLIFDIVVTSNAFSSKVRGKYSL